MKYAYREGYAERSMVEVALSIGVEHVVESVFRGAGWCQSEATGAIKSSAGRGLKCIGAGLGS